MKSTKAARVILRGSIPLISLRAVDMLSALQTEDLWAWRWQGDDLNASDTVRAFFFSLVNEKVSDCRLAHFNILLLVKKGGGEDEREVRTTCTKHQHTHTNLLARICPKKVEQRKKKWPLVFLTWKEKKDVKEICAKHDSSGSTGLSRIHQNI